VLVITCSLPRHKTQHNDTEPIARHGNFSPQKGASSAFPCHLVAITVGESDSLDLEGFLPLNSSGIFPSTL
jgi:hypothetical protein